METNKVKMSMKMDPVIWSRLPRDVLEHVLSFLPLKTFLSIRSTCKHFKSLLFSPAFVSKHTSSCSSPFSSFLLLSHRQFHSKCPLFDTELNTWKILPLRSSPTLSHACSSNLASISNGHLCFSHPDSSSFIVCNVLARSARAVRFPFWPSNYESLTFVSTPNGYKIFVLLSSSGPSRSSTALLYDSSVRLWRQLDGPSHSLHHQEGVLHDGSMYFIGSEPSHHLLRLDLENREWGRSRIELPGEELVFARLVSDDDGQRRKLFLIGGIGSHGIARSMKLWELSSDDDEGEIWGWVEVERVPELMMRKFVSVCYHKYEHVYCFWHQGLVCICCYTWPEILYFKVSRKTWHWLPKCPFLPEKWSCGFRWFSFVPQLHAFT